MPKPKKTRKVRKTQKLTPKRTAKSKGSSQYGRAMTK